MSVMYQIQLVSPTRLLTDPSLHHPQHDGHGDLSLHMTCAYYYVTFDQTYGTQMCKRLFIMKKAKACHLVAMSFKGQLEDYRNGNLS